MRKDVQSVTYPIETHHIWDLTEAMGNTPSPNVPKRKPLAPLNHIIHNLVEGFQEAIHSNDISGIKHVLDQLILARTTCTDFLKYNRTELTSLKITVEKMVASTIQPPPASFAQQPQQHHQSQTIGLKTPRMETPTWNGDPYSFYSWLSSCSKSFDKSKCNNIARTQLMLQAMPLNK